MDEARGRLLVVDDIDENRGLLKRQLARRGYEVAVNAHRGLRPLYPR